MLFLDAGRKDVDVAETVVTSQTLQTFISLFFVVLKVTQNR